MAKFLNDVKNSFKTLKWYEWLMAAIMVGIAAWAMISAFINPSAGGNPPWLTVVNFVSAICGVVCIFFCAKANISNFVFGLVNTIVYIIYLWYWKIYGTFALEMFIYFPVNIISWIVWSKHRKSYDRKITEAKKLNWWQNCLTVLAVGGATVLYHAILVSVGGNVAWLDAMTVAIGIIATLLEMLRYREQYVWWIITDIVAVAMYVIQFDPVYLTKKSIYLIMAVIGLINWVKNAKENKANN